MPKKSKKVTKSVSKAKKVVVAKKATPKTVTAGHTNILLRRYESPVAFTMIVSCAAFAVFMMVNMVLQNVDKVLFQQDQAIMAMHQSETEIGMVAGAQDSAE